MEPTLQDSNVATNPIIPWPGGKRRLAHHILPLIPPHTCYVEVFAGGAAVLMAKEPSQCEVLNDLNGDLVNLYRVVQHHLEEFVRQFKWALVSRQMFEWAKLVRVETLTDVQRAARFFYLQRISYGAKVSGQTFGYSATGPAKMNLLRIEEDLSEAHLRLARVTIEHATWQDCIARYDRPETVFFLDPPYWQTEGYGIDFGFEQYEHLAEVMRTMAGRAILTINDHPDMARVFGAFPSTRVEHAYTIGGGADPKAVTEVIYRSTDWPIRWSLVRIQHGPPIKTMGYA